MPLAPGTRLGPYEILSPLGEGGMGEVYRARDPRLNREVAIKTSREQFNERFEREARAVAALNHPNICHLYDVGPNYLVMELVEGETLKGPLPIDEALKIADQIALALEAAHEKGIIHRDLKPANIKITPEGVVKVLDFGLARIAVADSLDQDNSPTLLEMPTEAGTILGTASYMAPEQARGKKADKRADIWAFAVVLYEILTGKRLFPGAAAGEILAGVLKDEPDLSEVPVKVRRLIQSCLEKEPKNRLRDIGDYRQLLDDDTAPYRAATVRERTWAGRIAAALAVALVGVSAVAYRATRPADLKPLMRFDVDLGADVSLGSPRGADAILSPDGTRLVYVSKGKLFTRKLDQPKATELAGTEGAYASFFSPDGQSVAFFDGSKLKKLSVEGGAPVVLCDAPFGFGGSWGEDGNIIAALFYSASLSRIPSAGGAPTPVTELGPGEVSQRWPQILPGGKAVLFTSNGTNVDVISLPDHRRKTLVTGGIFGRYLPTSKGAGHLLYVNNGTLFAVAFDPNALEVHGTPVPVLDQIAWNPTFGSAQLDVSGVPSGPGMLLYRSGGALGSGLVTVQWLDSTGKTQPLLAKPGPYSRLRLSPDGQRLALEIPEAANRDIWIDQWQRDTLTRLTFDAEEGAALMNPVWTPDGRYIVFSGKGGMFLTRSDGAGKPQPLTRSRNRQVPFSVTPDARRLAWQEQGSGGFDLWTMPLASDGAGLRGGKPEVLLQTAFDERWPMFSPDGRWLAYTSNESGSYQVYVRAFPDKADKGGKWQISNGGGAYPVWSHNGRELFFHSADNRIMVAAYAAKGDSFVPDQPKVWSEKQLAGFGIAGGSTFDVAPDGKRSAALMPVDTQETQQAQSHVIFLENFFDELRRKVPLNGK